MAKINRYDGNLLPFAQNFTGGNRTIFGETTQSNDITDNINTKFLQGWEATTDANTFPTKQDFNAVSYVSTALASYLHQVGIPEWNEKQEYHKNSFTNFSGVLYRCKTNDHTSVTDPSSDTINWESVTGDFVSKIGDETIDDIKTFTLSPIVPTPTVGDNSTKVATTAFVQANADSIVVASIIIMPVDSIPSGYLECNGAAISRTVFADLFAVIGTTYGAGNGSTTFNIPDLRGEFIRGFDNGRDVDGGRTIGSWQKGTANAVNDRYQGHLMTLESNSPKNLSAIRENAGLDKAYTADYSNLRALYSNTFTSANTNFLQDPSWGGGSTRPRNISMMYCIKY